MIIEVTNSDDDLIGEFGYVAQDTANQRVTVPRSCTTLAKTTKIVVTNFSRHKFLRLRRGELVAYFKKADRTSVNIYATNLAKLGTAENAFVDLATLCEQQEQICRITEEESILPTETNDKLRPDYACPTRMRDQNSYTTMLDDSAATKTSFGFANIISETGLQTFQGEGRDNEKRERVRNESDHLERPAKKYQRISTDATPPNVGYGTVIGANIRDDPGIFAQNDKRLFYH